MGDLKSFKFAQTAVSAATFQSFLDSPVQGQLLRVDVKSNITGSVFLVESGTNQALALLTTTSGTAQTLESVYPVISRETTAGVAAAAGTNLHGLPVVASRVFATGSGFVSGTTHTLDVELFWR